jgi:uracil-DNA glycosylase family 4
MKKALQEQLEALWRAGVRYLPRCEMQQKVSTGQNPAKPTSGSPRSEAPPGPATSPLDAEGERRLKRLQELEARVRQCTRCPELVRSRTQTVFGVGNPQAQLCFVGEAPGAEEDAQGEPFVGPAGQLLTKMIEAMGLRRWDVYICNVIKCRPPQNRTPLPDEVRHCADYLDEQLAIIQPKFICALGSVAAKRLLNRSAPLSKLRGRFYEYQGAKVLVTYHPAYLLRSPDKKKEAWEDLQLLMKAMGLPAPRKR